MTANDPEPAGRLVRIEGAPPEVDDRFARAERPGPRPGTILGAVGAVLLLAWAAWWAGSIEENRLIGARMFWFPPLEFLAGDFVVHIDDVARVWMAGGDPYDPHRAAGVYGYPPLVHRMFSWVSLVGKPQAMAAWLVALGGIAGAGAWSACRQRGRLGVEPIPAAFAMAAVVLSTPVVYAMERGNCDLLVVAMVLLGARLMRSRSLAAEALAGLVLAMAPWTKLYPGLLLVGLIGLRRWRVLACFILAGAAIGLADHEMTLRFLRNAPAMTGGWNDSHLPTVYHWEHSLTVDWPFLWQGTHAAFLARIPAKAAVALLLLPMLGWVARAVAVSRDRARLTLPFLLWVLAVATWVPNIANDYSLVYLPIAAVAVWSRRDAPIVHALMGLAALWWQPFYLPVDGKMLFAFKLAGLVGVALSLAARARESSPAPAREDAQARSPHVAAGRTVVMEADPT